jgi:hypothetical protein
MQRSTPFLLSFLFLALLYAGCRPDAPNGVPGDENTQRMRDSLLAAVQPGMYMVDIMHHEHHDDTRDRPVLLGSHRGTASFTEMPGGTDQRLTVQIHLNGGDMMQRPGTAQPGTGQPGTEPGAPMADQQMTPQQPQMGQQMQGMGMDDFEVVIIWQTNFDEMTLRDQGDRAPLDLQQRDETIGAGADRRPNVRAQITEHGRSYTSVSGELHISHIDGDRIRGSFVFEMPEAMPGHAPGDRPGTGPGAQGTDGAQRQMPGSPEQQPGTGAQQPAPGAQPTPAPGGTDGQAIAPPPMEGFHERDIRSRLLIGAFDASRGERIQREPQQFQQQPAPQTTPRQQQPGQQTAPRPQQ